MTDRLAQDNPNLSGSLSYCAYPRLRLWTNIWERPGGDTLWIWYLYTGSELISGANATQQILD